MTEGEQEEMGWRFRDETGLRGRDGKSEFCMMPVILVCFFLCFLSVLFVYSCACEKRK